MKFTRRTFLKLSAAAGAANLVASPKIFASERSVAQAYYSLHPFILNNPDAVFVIRTNVSAKTDADAIRNIGLNFGSSVFLPKDASLGGIPVTNKIAIKPNITCRQTTHPLYTKLGTMGIVTDANFVEGIIQSLKAVGVGSNKFFIRETNCPTDFEEGGWISMAQRTGADIRDLSAEVASLAASDVQWLDVPDGVWFNRIPFLAPVNSPDTMLLNIAKLKTHLMGMTLSAKNMQGSIAHSYQQHCTAYSATMNIDPAHIQSDAKQVILSNYNRHNGVIPRWDRPGDTGGIWQETWATRCLDTNSVTKPYLHIIEGIYGRDGNFVVGPAADGTATDYMTNYIIFGRNPFHVDNIGIWIGGHEPGNFGLLHMAIERGQSKYLNPEKIPLYEWKMDGTASLIQLSSLIRTPLRTPYLVRDYNGQTEDAYHLVNEPFTYPNEVRTDQITKPSFVLHQNYPNPFNPSTSVQFSIPAEGNVRIEICNVTGETVDVLADKQYSAGSHLVVWQAKNKANGVYFCRMLYNGSAKVKSMLLLK